MNIKNRTEKAALFANAAGDVLLTVTIGNAQIGGSIVINKSSGLQIAKGEISNLVIGSDATLKGKALIITTRILDVNPNTNGIVVTYFFGNATPVTLSYNDTVDNDGDIFVLTLNISF